MKTFEEAFAQVLAQQIIVAGATEPAEPGHPPTGFHREVLDSKALQELLMQDTVTIVKRVPHSETENALRNVWNILMKVFYLGVITGVAMERQELTELEKP